MHTLSQHIKFSIIIPHKNCTALLQRLLNSIPIRNDVQVIVVDDNSDPILVDFTKFPQWLGENYEVYFTKAGRGAGYARNIGIEKAIGEWLFFADSDDYYYSEKLTNLLNLSIVDDYDVVVFGTEYKYLDGLVKNLIYNPSSELLFYESTDNILLYKDLVMPWTKFVRKSFIKRFNIKFEEIICANDEMFATKVAINTHKYLCYNDLVYCHERVKGSLVENATPESLLCRAKVALRKRKLLMESNKTPIFVYGWACELLVKDYFLFFRYLCYSVNLVGFRETFNDYKVIRHNSHKKFPFISYIKKQLFK